MSSVPPLPAPTRSFQADSLKGEVYATNEAAGRAAAAAVAARLHEVLAKKSVARFIMATGNSQLAYTTALIHEHALPWNRIECFHMDEYVGIGPDHPASFRRWMRERVENAAHPKAFNYIQGDNPNPKAECARYAALLAAAPIDVVSLGIGENGHLAFNDPPFADFNDPVAVKIVQLDEACKQQQVGEGHFPSLAAVPTEAITLTISTLMKVASVFCIVPEARKAPAVKAALEGPIATSCPASVLRRQAHARLYLDAAAAGRLTRF